MAHVEHMVQASAEDTFAVLSDGWSYAAWVVGATHIRDVDPGWPAEGTRLHYRAGVWPFTVDDITQVSAVDPPRLLELEAKLRPFGSAWIRLELTETAPGRTRVRMHEHTKHGPGTWVPDIIQELLLLPRNQESLSRLADIVVGRSRDTADGDQDQDTSRA
ncbi:SRPBCC family protein [Nocardia sp. NBC_00881]|uniref:SRPBCC family protein n=1 Tax=Nocardia sp. NBC_00881 TaxID=2975995 RepID=UPI00386A7737|nr:SRPBCC family protein [Nocardia sp. NBC_00881]